MIVLLDLILLPIKHHVLLALQDNIKIKTISPVARMIVMLDRTLRPIKNRVLFALQDSTRT
jgi:hypothetical protein